LIVLVTGGLGFIGSNLVRELEARRHDVWVCDLFNSHRERYSRCDVREFRQLEKVLSTQRFDLVYHAAAEYGRWNGEDFHENLWATNVVGTKNVIRLQERQKFKMVLFSSAEVYGDYAGLMREDVMDHVPIKQMNDYAMSKWVNEMQVLNSSAMFGTETVRVRPFNVYGPGEHYTPYRGVVPTFIYKALNDEAYTVYKGHRRTFEYVEDVAKTLANVADNFKPGEVYNLGGDKQYEIKYVSDRILRELGKDDRLVTYREAEPFTTKDKKGDYSKALRDLKHRCVTSLDDGLARTVEWMRAEYGPNKHVVALTVK